MGIPLRRGRLFDDGDAPGAPARRGDQRVAGRDAVARQDPIGRYIQFGNMDGDLTGLRIVGIVGDVRELSIERAAPIVYVNARQARRRRRRSR